MQMVGLTLMQNFKEFIFYSKTSSPLKRHQKKKKKLKKVPLLPRPLQRSVLKARSHRQSSGGGEAGHPSEVVAEPPPPHHHHHHHRSLVRIWGDVPWVQTSRGFSSDRGVGVWGWGRLEECAKKCVLQSQARIVPHLRVPSFSVFLLLLFFFRTTVFCAEAEDCGLLPSFNSVGSKRVLDS